MPSVVFQCTARLPQWTRAASSRNSKVGKCVEWFEGQRKNNWTSETAVCPGNCTSKAAGTQIEVHIALFLYLFVIGKTCPWLLPIWLLPIPNMFIWIMLLSGEYEDMFQYNVSICRAEEADIRNRLDKTRKDLQNLESARKNTLRRFGEKMPLAMQKIAEAASKGQFHRKPVGPLGIHYTWSYHSFFQYS